jgi:hypothetical protein
MFNSKFRFPSCMFIIALCMMYLFFLFLPFSIDSLDTQKERNTGGGIHLKWFPEGKKKNTSWTPVNGWAVDRCGRYLSLFIHSCYLYFFLSFINQANPLQGRISFKKYLFISFEGKKKLFNFLEIKTEIRRWPTQWESQQSTLPHLFTPPEPTHKLSPYHPSRYASAPTDHCP